MSILTGRVELCKERRFVIWNLVHCHYMLIIRDAKLFLACIILVPQQNADVLNHHLNAR